MENNKTKYFGKGNSNSRNGRGRFNRNNNQSRNHNNASSNTNEFNQIEQPLTTGPNTFNTFTSNRRGNNQRNFNRPQNFNPQNNNRAVQIRTNEPNRTSSLLETSSLNTLNADEVENVVTSKIEPVREENSIEHKELSVVPHNMFPPKPKNRCLLGYSIRIATNHYPLELIKDFSIYQYDVSIYSNKKKPEENIGNDLGKEFYLSLVKIYPELKNKTFYDLKRIFYSLIEIQDFKFDFEMMDKRNMKKKFTAEIKKSKLGCIEFFTSEALDQIKLTVLQLLLTFRFKMNYLSIGKQNFFEKNCLKEPLGLNVSLWKGFFISIRPSESGLTINLNLYNSAFTERTNIVELACQFFKCDKSQLEKRLFNKNLKERKQFIDLIKRVKVTPTHLEYETKKTVKGLGDVSAKNEVLSDSRTMVDYYSQTYNIKLKHPDLPCLILGSKNKTPMELCETVVENQRNLDSKTQAEYIRKTAVECIERKKNLIEIEKSIAFESDPLLKDLVRTNHKMIELDGQVIGSPMLKFGDKDVKIIDGRWNNSKNKFYDPKSISKWVVYVIDKFVQFDQTSAFVNDFKRIANEHGIIINDPENILYPNDRDWERDPFTFFEKEVQKIKPDFIMAILKDRCPVYDALKTIGDISYGIKTQIIKSSLLSKKQNAMSNICLKVNAKLGGTNFVIKQEMETYIKYLKTFMDDDVMIFGCDVNKPSPADKNYRGASEEMTESVAAVTGSIDKNWSYYAARMLAQKKHKKESIEFINDLRHPVKELLEQYKISNQKFPKRLVFFRDGISEGEFVPVLNHEMNEIRKACTEIGYEPGVTYVVVQKRHHTRFFPLDPTHQIGIGKNVPPGLMVDTKVVTPDMFDFFLASHLGIKGTTKPCHYYMLHDENDFTNDRLILLSHYLCHLYARSTTAVSYPAPTYYADLCAERGRQYLTERLEKKYLQSENPLVKSYPINVHENFRDKMFFI